MNAEPYQGIRNDVNRERIMRQPQNIQPKSINDSKGNESKLQCFKCGSYGHFAKDCIKTNVERDVSGRPRCYNCGTFGHFARDCNKPQTEVRRSITQKGN